MFIQEFIQTLTCQGTVTIRTIRDGDIIHDTTKIFKNVS